jgi:5-oxoprolinase (ATP-hydrolysing)/N-methylhydantoinase A
MPRFRLGLDIGGTFTDYALQEVSTGRVWLWKRLTSTDNLAEGSVAGVQEVLRQAGTELSDVGHIVHGTTLGSNIIIEGTGARTALLVTAGFGDILAIQRQIRHSPYDLFFSRHAPLVPRDLVFEVDERIRHDGSIDRHLNSESLLAIVQKLRERSVESIAVVLLHSYANPRHEEIIEEVLKSAIPGVPTSLSSQIAPQIREYERASTTVINAYIRPSFEIYLSDIETMLRDGGFNGSVYLMQTSGGFAPFATVAKTPVRALESGPAAGIKLAGRYVQSGGAIAFEMGGTTAKASVLTDGEASLVSTFEVDQTLMRPNTGLPVQVPAVDLIEMGAGGGSIASEAFGTVTVGPESAGAAPGPASYGIGGRKPTVTDANVVLGYINPAYFNDGRLELRNELAREAIERDVGEPLQLSTVAAAWAIYEAATASMEHAIRAVSIERGYDPRELTLVAGGGAGPLHATRLARALGVPRVVVPRVAGVLSAVGLIAADPQFDLIHSLVAEISDGMSAVNDRLADLAAQALELLNSGGDTETTPILKKSLDMCYRGQGHSVEVELPVSIDSLDAASLRLAFECRYEQLYGHADPRGIPIITAVRVSARSPAPSLRLVPSEALATREPYTVAPLVYAHRLAFFPEAGGRIRCPVFRRQKLLPGQQITGPALVEDDISTVVLDPATTCTVDDELNLIIMCATSKNLGQPHEAVKDVDVLTLGTIWRSLVAAANDGGAALQRTAYSEAVREGRDFSLAIFDRVSRMVAQGDFSPGHLGSMPDVVKHVLDDYPLSDLAPGDAIVLNDPWLGSGHLPDFLMVVPVFHESDPVGFVVACVHMIDVGGAAPGSQAVEGITEVFQEGLRLPPTRVWAGGIANQEILRVIEANVRVPDKVLGDLSAMRNGCVLAGARLQNLVERYGIGVFDTACSEILMRSAAAMREAIGKLPQGSVHAVDYFDDYGPGTEPLRIEVEATARGGDLLIDFSGSDRQTASGINAVLNYTKAYSYFVAKAVLSGADMPQNAGSIQPICVSAPEGSCLNASIPKGVGARAIMQQRIVDVLMQALAYAVPDRVLAASSHWANPIVGGVDPRTGADFVFYDIIVGGFGGRQGADGIEAMCPSFNIDGIPVEVNEHAYPVLVERYELAADSAGPGTWRGGHGVRKDVRMLGENMRLSNLGERHKFPPPGVLGGSPGACGRTLLLREGHSTDLSAKGTYSLRHGDVVSYVLSGGGGYGPARDRNIDDIMRDIRYGWLTYQAAKSLYGLTDDVKTAAGFEDGFAERTAIGN